MPMIVQCRKGRFVAVQAAKAVPSMAFRVLDAPRLKDDYYCSVLAYTNTFHTLAVALTHRVYLWTELHGVKSPPMQAARPSQYVLSLAFSSEQGRRGILAVSRSNGQVTLWSLKDPKPRLELVHHVAACCVSFRPIKVYRASSSGNGRTEFEDLLVGDDEGDIFYYGIEWQEYPQATASLLIKIDAHRQNICGLCWSHDGRSFASGGNDNAAAFFVVSDVLKASREKDLARQENCLVSPQVERALKSILIRPELFSPRTPQTGLGAAMVGVGGLLTPSASPNRRPRSPSNQYVDPHLPGVANLCQRFFPHSAAVKAIAFAPWQPSLLATGGGSNDRQIRFHHTVSGTTLAVINVFAQVTSLTWSKLRREITATFGYAQPDHQIRIAVFAWPSCECVVSIPWEKKLNGEVGRALWAIPYPGGPNDTSMQTPQTLESDIQAEAHIDALGPRTSAIQRSNQPTTPQTSPLRSGSSPIRDWSHMGFNADSYLARHEGERWTNRTREEGSLIIACCDQTVKFFEIWPGKSKGRSAGVGFVAGVLGGSRILEGLSEDIGIDEVGNGKEVIR